jgi:hypothetical protein
MATLTSTPIARAGVTITGASATSGGDKFGSTGKEFLWVKNADTASHNVIFAVQKTVDGLAVTSRTVTVGAGAEMLIGPFKPSEYNDANGLVNVTYSAVTSVTVAVFSLSAESSQS